MAVLTRFRASITERNARESPLLQLPAELRNKIWHYAVDDVEGNYEGFDVLELLYSGLLVSWKSQPHRRALLRVCRQIHCETAQLPVVFTLTSDALSFDFYNDIGSLPKRLRSVTEELHLTVCLTTWNLHYFVDDMRRYGLSFSDVLPNVKRVDIHYDFAEDDHKVEDRGIFQEHIEFLEDWLRAYTERKMEVNVKKSFS